MMTEKQEAIVGRLLAKGWLDVWHHGGSAYLFLPLAAHKRRGRFRNEPRPVIRVTKTGRIIAGYAGENNPYRKGLKR